MTNGQTWILIAALALVPALIAAAMVWERRMNRSRDREFAAWAARAGLGYTAGAARGAEVGVAKLLGAEAKITNLTRGTFDGHPVTLFDAERWRAGPRTGLTQQGTIQPVKTTFVLLTLGTRPPVREEHPRWQIDCEDGLLLLSWRREIEPRQLDEFAREAVQVARSASTAL